MDVVDDNDHDLYFVHLAILFVERIKRGARVEGRTDDLFRFQN